MWSFILLTLMAIQCGSSLPQEYVGAVHPIATGTFPGPLEEDLTSPMLVESSPNPQVPVTLPFVFQRPPSSSKIPSSYLRPLMIDFQQEDSSEEMPEKPLEEDLTSPSVPSAGVAVTLPFLLTPSGSQKPYLRPLLVDSPQESGPPASANPAGPTRNAVTLPFVPSSSGKVVPASYLRPATDAATDPAQHKESASPMTGTVHTLPNGVQLIYKPASYLRPSLADGSYHLTDPYHQQTEEASPVKPSRPVKVQPLIADVLAEEQWPSRPLKPIKQKWRPLIIQSQDGLIITSMSANEQSRPWWIVPRPYQQISQAAFVMEPPRYQHVAPQNRPWMVPVARPITMDDGSTRYQLLRPVAVRTKSQEPVDNQQPFAGQSEGRAPFLTSWIANQGGSKNPNVTLVYTKNGLTTGTSTVYSTTVYTVTSIISNAYCFTSLVDQQFPTQAAPWCSFRRKRTAKEDEAILTLQGETIQPSQVEKILTTALPKAPGCIHQASADSISSSMEEPQESRQDPAVEGRFFNIVQNQQLVKLSQPTTTVLVTILTTTTQVSITTTPTPIGFAAGTCIPRCLQTLPTCTAAPVGALNQPSG